MKKDAKKRTVNVHAVASPLCSGADLRSLLTFPDGPFRTVDGQTGDRPDWGRFGDDSPGTQNQSAVTRPCSVLSVLIPLPP